MASESKQTTADSDCEDEAKYLEHKVNHLKKDLKCEKKVKLLKDKVMDLEDDIDDVRSTPRGKSVSGKSVSKHVIESDDEDIIEDKKKSSSKPVRDIEEDIIEEKPKPSPVKRYKSQPLEKAIIKAKPMKKQTSDKMDEIFDDKEERVYDKPASIHKRKPTSSKPKKVKSVKKHSISADDEDSNSAEVIDDVGVKPAKKEEKKEKKADEKEDKPAKKGNPDAEFRQRRLYFADNLATKVSTGSNKEFLDKSEKFAVIVYQEEDPRTKDEKV